MLKLKNIDYGFISEPKGLTRPLYQQVHGNALIQINEKDLPHLYESPPKADGAITFDRGVKLSVFTADCIPLLFFTEKDSGPIATIHCGWRGAQQSIISSLEDLWSDYLGTIHVIIGPCLEPCCFEVKEDLISAFSEHGHDISAYLEKREGKYFFQLSRFVIEQQLKFIDPSHIHTQHLRCTFCSEPQLPSYRRNKSTDPRIKGWIRKN